MLRMNSVCFCCAVTVAWLGMMIVNAQAETPVDILKRIEARCDRYATVDYKWKVVSEFTEHYGKRVQFDPFGRGFPDARGQVPPHR